MTDIVKIVIAAVGGFVGGYACRYLYEKHNSEQVHEAEFKPTPHYRVISCDDTVDMSELYGQDAVDHLYEVANAATQEENVPEDYIYETDDLDEVGVSHEKLDAEHIPYGEGVRVIGDAEFASLSTSDDVESIELVYFAEDGMISEEGDIFSTMSETEVRKMLGDAAWDIVVEGGFDEVHFYNDHDYILYTVTRYDGAWGDMAAYAAGSGR